MKTSTLIVLLATLVTVSTNCTRVQNGTNADDAVSVIPSAVAEPLPNPEPEPELDGFIMPIEGACLPKSNRLIPNSMRPYRKGIHEGVDFYHSDNCTKITRGTRVVAVKAGRVIRADWEYNDLTAATLKRHLSQLDEEAMDQFRGRQVWIDHGAGVVSRYAHLNGIAPDIAEGMTVSSGQLIGFVGESGTPASVSKPGYEYHLHFEIRVGEFYAGQDLEPADVRQLYRRMFGLEAAEFAN